MADGQVEYTVYIKVPFPRGDFEDPPNPHWTSAKDKELWKILSSTSKGKEIDWEAIAHKFDANIQFLLQQAAWLYEKQLFEVREQLRKVGKNPAGSSPVPVSVSGSASGATTGVHAIKRPGSSGGSRVPSSLSIRQRASGDFRTDTSVPSTPVQSRVPYSRTTSKDTVTQLPQASANAQSWRRSNETAIKDTEMPTRKRSDPKSPSSDDDSDSDSSSSSSGTAPTQSRAFARRPNFSSPMSKSKAAHTLLSSAEEDEEDDAPAFLPYSEPKQVRKDHAGKGKQPARRQDHPAIYPSTSSSQSLPSPAHHSSSGPSISSPKTHPVRRSPMAALSPRQRRIAQEGSEGTPSMGSSFSDLEDSSITQSALEEALAREIKAGKGSVGVVSRVGGLWKGQGPSQGKNRPG